MSGQWNGVKARFLFLWDIRVLCRRSIHIASDGYFWCWTYSERTKYSHDHYNFVIKYVMLLSLLLLLLCLFPFRLFVSGIVNQTDRGQACFLYNYLFMGCLAIFLWLCICPKQWSSLFPLKLFIYRVFRNFLAIVHVSRIIIINIIFIIIIIILNAYFMNNIYSWNEKKK